MKSLVAIPELFKNAIFIEELPNNKNNGKYDKYRSYVAGLNIGGVDYTVKKTVGVDEYGNKYYDQALTEIEKGRLIDKVGALSTTLPSNNKSAFIVGKDTKLVSILQINSSKVLDENGEPMVVSHSTNGKFYEFRNKQENDAGWLGDGYYFFLR